MIVAYPLVAIEYALIAVSIIALGVLIYISFIVYTCVHWHVPYAPTYKHARHRLRSMLSVKPGDQVLDLGCGLGAMLVFLSRYPIKVTGIDIVKVFCVLSRLRLYLLPFRKARTSVINKDFRFISFNNFTIIYAFLVPDALAVLRPKFEAEMRDEALLITYKCPALLSTELFDQSVFEEQPNSFFFFYRKKAIVLNR